MATGFKCFLIADFFSKAKKALSLLQALSQPPSTPSLLRALLPPPSFIATGAIANTPPPVVATGDIAATPHHRFGRYQRHPPSSRSRPSARCYYLTQQVLNVKLFNRKFQVFAPIRRISLSVTN